jgi:putative nucleotidyltransferase with HDIG domain
MGFELEEIKVLERLSVDIGLIMHSHKQQSILRQMETDRILNYEETILAFVNIIEQRDTYTAGHTIRVAEYCKKIASVLTIAPEEIKKLERAAILHDIGKVATPDSVLLKPGKLTSLEYDLIKQHAYAGFDMLSKIDMYKDLAEIIRFHHVHYDGKGYPQTDNPDDVPFLSHIMAVADAFDAMTTTRIYRPKRSIADALNEIEQRSGSQFHPKVVAATLIALKDTLIVTTTQTPSNELEQKRFSYFFCDSLTDLYNENYLKIVLANNENKYTVGIACFLGNFSTYNRNHGWDSGNQLLIDLAKTIRDHYPEALVFRYHGDDFILLFAHQTEVDNSFLENMPLLKDKGITITLNHYNLKEDTNSIFT